jgi:hypothetical protein
MPATKRATIIYFEPAIYETLKERAAATKTSISKIVNELLQQRLIEDEEDAQDHAIFEQRRGEPSIPFEDFVADMKRRGRI